MRTATPCEPRICKQCGRRFSKRPLEGPGTWNSPKRAYCSRDCSNLAKIGRPNPKAAPPRVVRPTEPIQLPNGSVIHWNERDANDDWRQVPVTCGACQTKRTVAVNNAIRRSFAGLCKACNLEAGRSSQVGPTHSKWLGGHFIDSRGYPAINIRALSGRAYELASQMARLVHGKPAVIHEHRLIVALSLDRPLRSDEVIHHRNGNKHDNRLENLELTSPAEHRQMDAKYFRLWQKAAARVAELEMQLLRCQDGRGE